MFNPVTAAGQTLTGLKAIVGWFSKAVDFQKSDSLIRFTKSTRVEPIVMVDQSLTHLPFITDVMQTLSSIFSAYYLQAASLMVNIDRINVMRLLDTLNPNRDVADASLARISDTISGESMLSLESYRYGLPMPGKQRIKPLRNIGLEADGGENANDEQNKGEQKPELRAAIDKTQKGLSEAISLSVGRMLEVTVDAGEGKKATFPIMVRLISTIVDSRILVHILGDNSRTVTLKERFHSWRAGQIDFWRDLVFCQDLIDEHRKALINDKTGTYSEILQRRRNNNVAAVMTTTPSVANASNMMVISKATAKLLEAELGGRLSDYKKRQHIFNSTYLMILVVVDPQWEQVTFYHRGIAIPTEVSARELKTANKGSGPDVAEILKAYTMGTQITI